MNERKTKHGKLEKKRENKTETQRPKLGHPIPKLNPIRINKPKKYKHPFPNQLINMDTKSATGGKLGGKLVLKDKQIPLHSHNPTNSPLKG